MFSVNKDIEIVFVLIKKWIGRATKFVISEVATMESWTYRFDIQSSKGCFLLEKTYYDLVRTS